LGRARRAPPPGLMGSLVEAVEGGALTAKEAASIVLQILVAGSDSSASLMGSAVRMMAEDPALQERLRADPALVAPFIEEVIRLEAPFQGHFRQTTRECELAGHALPAGTRIFATWASGNRDERRYDHPQVVDLARASPRSHLSFGHGIHLCIGAALGRLEARVAVTSLLRRTLSVELAEEVGRHRPSMFVRTLERLPIRVIGASSRSYV
jgi:cytochrome P450